MIYPIGDWTSNTECRAETQTLSYWFTLHTRDVKFISHNSSILKIKKIEVSGNMDVYLQSSWEDVALEVTMSSVKITDITTRHIRLISSAFTMTNQMI